MASGRTAAIHQPNFFPWLGYFNKIARSDVFVLLDDAQHTRTGGSWSNRVQLLANGQPYWATAPVRRPADTLARLDQIRWADGPWRAKLAKSLSLQYGRTAHFREVMPHLSPLVDNPVAGLVDYNVHAVRTISALLGLQTRFVLASTFELASRATQRLADLTAAVDCDTYLAGGGADGYQEAAVFDIAGIKLEFQAFAHPTYPQAGGHEFIAGLSIIDALMNCGIERTRELVHSPCRPLPSRPNP